MAASLSAVKDDNSLCNPESDSCFASPHLLCKRLIRVCICYKGTFYGKLGELISLLQTKWKEMEPKLTVRFGMIWRSLYCTWIPAPTIRAVITGIVVARQMMNYPPQQKSNLIGITDSPSGGTKTFPPPWPAGLSAEILIKQKRDWEAGSLARKGILGCFAKQRNFEWIISRRICRKARPPLTLYCRGDAPGKSWRKKQSQADPGMVFPLAAVLSKGAVNPLALPLPGVLQNLGKNQKAETEGKGLRFPAVPKVILGLCFQELSHWLPVFLVFIEQTNSGFETKRIFFPPMAQPLNWRVCQQRFSVLNLARKEFGAFHSHCLEMMLCHSTRICFGSPKIFPWKWRGLSSVAVAFFNLVSQINSTCCIWRALSLNTPAKNIQPFSSSSESASKRDLLPLENLCFEGWEELSRVGQGREATLMPGVAP